jgi:invasion protein IalB
MKEVTAMSMTELTRTLALTLGLSMAALGGISMAVAQETAPAAPAEAPAEGETVTADAPTADGLSMGADANAAVAAAPKTQETAEVGETYLAQNIETWEVRCVKTADGSDPCQLYQLLKDAQGTSVAEMSMFALPEGGQAAAGATIIAPLETLLTANLVIAIDGGTPKIYPFTFCATLGCIARVGFTAEEVGQFKKGAKAVMTIVPAAAPEQKVALDISLKGFTAGYDAVAATMPKAE